MALPSSPPLLPEIILPSSPPAPSLDLPSTFPRTLKRQISDYASQQSSDPVFSDTPSDAEQQLDEQGEPKRKKIVKGPWWNVRRNSGQVPRRRQSGRTKIRNFDSGVWMGSDSSEASSASIVSDEQRLQMSDGLASDECDTIPDSEAIAAEFIQRCLDQGKEAVDLTDLGLYNISNVTLRPLHQLIRHSHDNLVEPPSEDEFVPLIPSLQMFLAKNSLSSLPTELFTFDNLTVLSLRSNQLSDLPPAIGRLRNLEELNVAGNRLSTLPWEMLDLFNCRQTHREITIRPNPLLDPVDLTKGTSTSGARHAHGHESMTRELYRQPDSDGMRQVLNDRLQHARKLICEKSVCRFLCIDELIHLASSKVHYFAVNGKPMRRDGVSVRIQGGHPAVQNPLSDAPSASIINGVPSLYELALRSLQANFDLQDVNASLRQDAGVPDAVVDSLETAATNVAEFGNEKCSTCERQMIIARATWVEYWFHGVPSEETLTRDEILPFMRKACSWACAKPTEIGTDRSGKGGSEVFS